MQETTIRFCDNVSREGRRIGNLRDDDDGHLVARVLALISTAGFWMLEDSAPAPSWMKEIEPVIKQAEEDLRTKVRESMARLR